MPDFIPTPATLARQRLAMLRALRCLYIAVEEPIADDVMRAVLHYTTALEQALEAHTLAIGARRALSHSSKETSDDGREALRGVPRQFLQRQQYARSEPVLAFGRRAGDPAPPRPDG